MAIASSSSSSSVIVDGFKYDVFLSFRGEDTRHEFTGSLWKALDDKRIRTFFDEEDIHKGDEITPSLLQSIEESRMALIVLSPNYASSSFCLDELSHILHSIRGNGRLVWPIFYDVEPSDVRKLKGTYGEAMTTHDANSNYSTDRLEKWKKALNHVANLSGTHFKKGNQHQYAFIEAIVKEVSKLVKPLTLHVGDYLVGLEPQMKDVISRLNLGSEDGIHMVGIHGIGGIGKTTLAVAVYNSIVSQFQGSCYLENVREESEKHRLIYLQNIILSKIVGEKEIQVTSLREGIETIKQRLQTKKVLLLLDDVNKLEQLQAIAGRPEWFGRGSRVIITTRDTGLLTRHGVKITYEMTGLNQKDAFELLRQKACLVNEVSQRYRDILNRVLTYSSGLPLALEVIGSQLIGQTVEQCECELDHYESNPHERIQVILKVSFNALSEQEKRVFLDIACVFKGHKLADCERILHAHHGESKKHHITVLVEKSLIKISECGHVILHDLIEDMGKEIVKQESLEEPGRRSRLWSSKDIVQVLQENTGSSEIEIIYLDCPNIVECDGMAFKKMKNLKTLIIRCVEFSQYPKHLPNSLRVLQLHCSSTFRSPSSEVLRFDSHPKKLVICEIECMLYGSNMCRNLFEKTFQYMKGLHIDQCSLTHIGNLSGLSNLEELSISGWWSLTTIDKSMGMLYNLKTLFVRSCPSLTSFLPLMLPSLEKLILFDCHELENVQSKDGWLDKLKVLKVKWCRKLKSIPPLKLPLLEVLKLSSCYDLESIPPIYGLLDKLQILEIYDCSTIKSIPPLNLPSLEELKISYCGSLLSIQLVRNGSLDKLKILAIYDCYKLMIIPPLNFPSLDKLILRNLNSHESVPVVGDGSQGDFQMQTSFSSLELPSLVELYISYCDTLESISSSINESSKLKIMKIIGCRKLESLPRLKLPSLVKLKLSYCHSLESIPHLMLLSLEKLNLSYCANLEHIPSLKLPSLEILDLSHCDSLKSISPMDEFMGKLKFLHIHHCQKLRSIPSLRLPLLEKLDLSYCGSLESIPHLKLPLLEELNLSYCASLRSIAKNGSMIKLLFLGVEGCRKLRSIPPLNSPLLRNLTLSYCDNLESFPKLSVVMDDITDFRIEETPIKELPLSFQNLTHLEYLSLTNCGIVQLPSSIVSMPKLTHLTMKRGGWEFSKKDEGKEKRNPMQSSRVEFITLWYCDLSNESLAIGLKWFANVKELNLSGSSFTTLPECIKNCHVLVKLLLAFCDELCEIKGIPPSLKVLSALDCKSLTKLSKRKLLNQEHHEDGNTNFLVARAEIPEWINHRCWGGVPISFWFRNKFPAIIFCVVGPLRPYLFSPSVKVVINGNEIFYRDEEIEHNSSEVSHLHIFHMKMHKFSSNPNKAVSENEWNHVEIELDFSVKYAGIDVLNGEDDDVTFTRPNKTLKSK